MSRMQRATREALETSRYILIRNLPRTCTSGDLRRAFLQADIKGVESVQLLYTHYRPTGKAVLTISQSSYTQEAIRGLQDLHVSGARINSEAVYNMWDKLKGREMGDGPSAGLEASKAVTMSGFPGKTSITDMYKLLKDFDVKKVKAVPM